MPEQPLANTPLERQPADLSAPLSLPEQSESLSAQGEREKPPASPARKKAAGKGNPPEKSQRKSREKAQKPTRRPAKSKTSGKKRRRESPIPVSMWPLPFYCFPFSNPKEFVLWLFTGINFWAVGAVILCALAGYSLIGWLSRPRAVGVEQALSGGESTKGLSYVVERTGEEEITVTGFWDPEAGQEPPTPELAAALCAALSPDAIYGHSDHLYRSIAEKFFQGEDFSLTICLREKLPKGSKEEPPEPVFSITRKEGDRSWPQPDCDAAFARRWRESYGDYWLFGQGRKEEMGPPQSDPIIEIGDLPPESEPAEEDDNPPLPDLDEESSGEGPSEGEPEGPEDGESGEDSESASSDGGSFDEDPPPPESRREVEEPEGFFGWVLQKAKELRQEEEPEGFLGWVLQKMKELWPEKEGVSP